MNRRTHRREFLRNTALTGAALAIPAVVRADEKKPPVKPSAPAIVAGTVLEAKINIGVIGAGGRGGADTGGVLADPAVNIVALCDINEEHLAKAAQHLAEVRKQSAKPQLYYDWRKLLDQKDIDAVIIATPDHHHALAAVAAMKRGKHVYCEKPLAHSVHEARMVRDTYNQSKVATQMGTQIHATDNYRRVVELIQSGAIGAVKEAHVWCTRVGPNEGTTRPKDCPAVPGNIHWDEWLGAAPQRPYHPSYLGGCMVWEQWWDFGNGCLGDMGSHLIDLPFWALKLRQPTSVEAEGAYHSKETYPQWLTVKWEHSATAERPALALHWYDGKKFPPSPPGIDLTKWGIGVLFVGEKGQLVADYGRKVLLPAEKFKDFAPPTPTIPPSLGHYREWLHACRTGAPTLCNFDYSGMLVEHNLLGTVAWRVGKKLAWDPQSMKAVGCPEADQYIRREYRKGWTI
jgi:predicted dehydrogenase